MEVSQTLTHKEWIAEAARLFGEDPERWRFKCPSCGHEASVADYKAAGAPEGAIAFSCIGRWTGGNDANTFKLTGGPCTYAGGGLFGLNPVTVTMPNGTTIRSFAFGEPVGANVEVTA